MTIQIQNIVIVGGGSAGWMSATTFKSFFPDKNITVIESPNVPTVGVGESTLGGIRNWLHSVNIKEDDFFKHTNASYKMSIKFTDFYKKDAGSFHYPFGLPFLENAPEGLAEWQAKRLVYPDTPTEDYCRTYFPSMPLIENNKFFKNDKEELMGHYHDQEVAYHFDAHMFAAWLRDSYCKPKGVNHIQDEVVSVSVSDNGVDYVVLSSGVQVSADLFIDCTGWKSLLLGSALNEPFTPYDHILPNNRAWAVQVPYTDKEKELEPYTNCTAIGNGWVWNIPLWTRLGTGYVYSDKHISPEDALQEFKDHLNSKKMSVYNPNRVTDDLDFKDIKMRIGIHERTWVKNVVAIGLSSGFIEPLESNGLFSVHEFLLTLVNIIDKDYITQWDKDVYNTTILDMFNNLAEFVSLHFALSVRDDTSYWRELSEKSFCPNMIKQIPMLSRGFTDLVARKMNYQSHAGPGGIHCIATGMNYFVLSRVNKLNVEFTHGTDFKKHVDDFIENRKIYQNQWERIADTAPSLYEYLKTNVYTE